MNRSINTINTIDTINTVNTEVMFETIYKETFTWCSDEKQLVESIDAICEYSYIYQKRLHWYDAYNQYRTSLITEQNLTIHEIHFLTEMQMIEKSLEKFKSSTFEELWSIWKWAVVNSTRPYQSIKPYTFNRTRGFIPIPQTFTLDTITVDSIAP